MCHLQHKLIGFYNRDEKCLLRGTNWVFKYCSLRFDFKRLSHIMGSRKFLSDIWTNFRTGRLRLGLGSRKPLAVEDHVLSRQVHLGFVVDEVALVQVPPPVPLSLVSFLHFHLYLNTIVIKRRNRRSFGILKQNRAAYDMGQTLGEKM
jgi:hypothetical protein